MENYLVIKILWVALLMLPLIIAAVLAIAEVRRKKIKRKHYRNYFAAAFLGIAIYYAGFGITNYIINNVFTTGLFRLIAHSGFHILFTALCIAIMLDKSKARTRFIEAAGGVAVALVLLSFIYKYMEWLI